MIVDCDTCVVRDTACGDCVVTVLLGAPGAWGDDEQRALGVLAASGLVPPLRLVPAGSDSGPGDPAGPGVSDDTPGRSRQAV